jgi:hypothetical protein
MPAVPGPEVPRTRTSITYQSHLDPTSTSTKPPSISQVSAQPVSNSARAHRRDEHQRDYEHLDLAYSPTDLA